MPLKVDVQSSVVVQLLLVRLSKQGWAELKIALAAIAQTLNLPLLLRTCHS
ncbi:hypothetical protein H6F77_08865 [Microcoleus sp. FACHB-831]|uniref:hypothetical protein n=1 Tax=Microcoleus sp. FACHB-831 TaxID=2692827 RepID=UPI001684A7F3|nr:hypothetical protein [Microcoleus sp. FACHB-831]MBD1921202.1 hypothetical protein [Microcoleus sp. FACHB-831]